MKKEFFGGFAFIGVMKFVEDFITKDVLLGLLIGSLLFILLLKFCEE